jgi:aspartyl-tRNA(Asn)/glutamyl-tRNA(Gln) amidotransferase subunit A
MPDLNYLSITEAHELLVAKKISAQELTEFYIGKIRNLNPKIRAVLTVCESQALKQAKKVDTKITSGAEIGLLEGIPYTAKDMFMTKGIRTTAASKILEDYSPPYSATVIEKLDHAGAVLIAKVNQDEFAHGGSTENSSYHVTHNPWDLERVPGGSSGGSAASVAADFGIFSLGTDTGGSIRQPASYCGVTGFKPTYGVVSRYGVIAMASSFDCVGPVARSAEDAQIVFEFIAGKDSKDSTTIALSDKTLNDKNPDGKLKAVFYDDEDSVVVSRGVAAIDSSLLDIRTEASIAELVPLELALAAYYVLVPSEISSNLERYDGVRYGSKAKDSKDLLDSYMKTRSQFLGPEVVRRNIIGTYALSAGYYDAYYKKAMQVRTLIIEALNKVFEANDAILIPTTLQPAFKLGSKSDPVEMYKTDLLTVFANLAGVPAISIPIGFDPTTGLPMGLQIIGKQGDDKKVLAIAKRIQSGSDWHNSAKELKL